MIYIYALIDPRSNEIRYIGKSIRPKERLWNHYQDKCQCHRTHWLAELKRDGFMATIKILQTLPDNSDWQKCERRWILKGKSLGWPLTNNTEGGDGTSGLPEETRMRMALTWKGRKHRPDSLLKIGAASKGRKHSDASKERMRIIMTGRKIEWVDRVRDSMQKLSIPQVIEIKARLERHENQYSIAKEFGVHQGTISNIKRGISYAHVSK